MNGIPRQNGKRDVEAESTSKDLKRPRTDDGEEPRAKKAKMVAPASDDIVDVDAANEADSLAGAIVINDD